MTGTYTTKGKRPRNEDVHVVGDLEKYSTLNNKQQQTAFESTFDEMQKQHGNHPKTGSTAIAVAITGNKVSVGNAGDSVGFSVVRNKKTGKVVSCTRLNNLHNADNNFEKARLEEDHGTAFLGGYLHGGEDGTSVAVSRAIGDTSVNVAGLTHKPEFTPPTTIDIPEDCEAFVIVACDGLTEAAKKKKLTDTEYLKQKIEGLPKKCSAEEMPKLLANAAIADGSKDNITVLAHRIDPKNTDTKLLAVFDGHGGKQVSAALGQHFLTTLQKNVTEIAQKTHEDDATLANISEFEETDSDVDDLKTLEKPDDVVKLSPEEEKTFKSKLSSFLQYLRDSKENVPSIFELNKKFRYLIDILDNAIKAQRKALEKEHQPIAADQITATFDYYLRLAKANAKDTLKLETLIEIPYFIDNEQGILERDNRTINMEGIVGFSLAQLLVCFSAAAPNEEKVAKFSFGDKVTLDTFLDLFGVTNTSQPKLILDALFTASDNPFVQFGQKAFELIENISMKDIQKYAQSNPKTSLAFPQIRLHNLFLQSKAPFDAPIFKPREMAKKNYKETKDISVDAFVNYVEKNPSAFSAIFGKQAIGERNLRKEVGKRPDLLIKLFNLARNAKPEDKEKITKAFTDLSKSSHFDHAGLTSREDYKDIKAKFEKQKSDPLFDIIKKIENSAIRKAVEDRLKEILPKFSPKDWPKNEQMEKLVESINESLRSEKGLTKNAYVKACSSQKNVVFDAMIGAKINKEPHKASAPTPKVQIRTDNKPNDDRWRNSLPFSPGGGRGRYS